MIVSLARPSDAAALLALRNHYIAESFATFDEAPLGLPAVLAWIAGFAEAGAHRLLVARDAERLLGYCCSQPYRAHPAFARTVETSVVHRRPSPGLPLSALLLDLARRAPTSARAGARYAV